MMAVAVRPSPELSLGLPTRLFQAPDGMAGLDARFYELHPDAKPTLVTTFKPTQDSIELTLKPGGTILEFVP